MPPISNQMVSWSVASIILIAVVVSVILSWRLGRASYLENLKLKHFGDHYCHRDEVSSRLHNISVHLADLYKSRDLVIQDMKGACDADNRSRISRLSEGITELNANIKELRIRRHEAEATAKLIGFGQLVDEIHAKGLSGPKPTKT